MTSNIHSIKQSLFEYSRDWTEPVRDENGAVIKEGELSTRMTLPGNMWQDLWEQAKAVPAHRQRR